MISNPKSDEITIAVTVYDRDSFIFQAVQSALEQRPQVRVIVVEDHSPNTALQKMVLDQFGSHIRYYRTARRRGLFGCWNECLELCETEWISILHDDDYLYSDFVENILHLSHECPGKGVYFSSHDIVDTDGNLLRKHPKPGGVGWRELSPQYMSTHMDTLFPGQLFHVASAKQLGWFMETSLYCGDWDMWHRLTCRYGSVQSLRTLAASRAHDAPLRGTSRVIRNGRKRGLEFVQIKRNLFRLKSLDASLVFSRSCLLKNSPLALKETLPWLPQLSAYMQKYLMGLLILSDPPNIGYKIIRKTVLLTGLRGWILSAIIYRICVHAAVFFRKMTT